VPQVCILEADGTEDALAVLALLVELADTSGKSKKEGKMP
jgi:hypothetical protein